MPVHGLSERSKDTDGSESVSLSTLVGHGQSAAPWGTLTRIRNKPELYGHETYFREGLGDAQNILGVKMMAALHRGALLVVKPEGLVSGKVATIVEFLHSWNFSIAGAALQSLTRFHWREFWRYQLSAATLDRLAVNDLIMRDQVLVLLLRHDGPLDVPATVWLSSLKGPSDIASQSPKCLRRLLAQPNRLFSCFHTADEPADLLRELAILFEQPERELFLSKLVGGALLSAEKQLVENALATSNHKARTFDALESIESVERATEEVVGIAAEQVRGDLARMRRGGLIAWSPFARAVSSIGVHIDRWDLAMIGATFISYDEPGISKLITSVGLDAWR